MTPTAASRFQSGATYSGNDLFRKGHISFLANVSSGRVAEIICPPSFLLDEHTREGIDAIGLPWAPVHEASQTGLVTPFPIETAERAVTGL